MVKECKLDLVPSASHFNIEGASGSIPCYAWGNVTQARAAVVLVHGLNAHGGWFEPAAKQFKLNNIYTVAYDQAGFGQRRSQMVKSYKEWLQDLETVFYHVQNQVGGSFPIFILGNSMGALTVASVARKLKPSGIILTAPAFAGHPKSFTLSFTIKTMIKALLNPSWRILEPTNIEQITRSPEAQEWILENSGPYLAVPAGIFLQIYFMLKTTSQKFIQTNCPVLMLTAQYDSIVDNQSSMQIFNKLKDAPKTQKEITGAYHDLLLDPMLKDITSDIIQWIQQWAAQPTSALKSSPFKESKLPTPVLPSTSN